MKLFICHKKVANTFAVKKSHWRRWQTMVFIEPSSKKSTERNSLFFKESLTKEERVYREEQKVSLRVPKLHRFNKHHGVWSYCNVKKSLFQTSSKLPLTMHTWLNQSKRTLIQFLEWIACQTWKRQIHWKFARCAQATNIWVDMQPYLIQQHAHKAWRARRSMILGRISCGQIMRKLWRKMSPLSMLSSMVM